MRYVLIGAWGHAGQVLDELATMPGAMMTGLAPGLPGDDMEAVRRLPVAAAARCCDDPLRMLREQRPDLAIISTRPDRIAPLAAAAAREGCHLVCEKPLAIRHDDLEHLWTAVAGSRVQCLAMLANRSRPVLAAACQAIRAGVIGRVVLLEARKSYRFGTRPEWFGRRETYGGTIPWVGIHALDFIDAASGGVPVRRVAAMHANAGHPERPQCEDICGLLLELADGALATAGVDYFRPAAAPTHGDDWLRVVGTRGVLEAGMDRGHCTLTTAEAPPRELPLPPPAPGFAPLLAALPPAGASPPDAGTRRGFALTHVALCARDAADDGRIVAIPPAPWWRRQAEE